MFAHAVLVSHGPALVGRDGILKAFQHGTLLFGNAIEFLHALEQPERCFTARMGLAFIVSYVYRMMAVRNTPYHDGSKKRKLSCLVCTSDVYFG